MTKLCNTIITYYYIVCFHYNIIITIITIITYYYVFETGQLADESLRVTLPGRPPRATGTILLLVLVVLATVHSLAQASLSHWHGPP